ncbi:uncharacterized protein LOC132264553 isoform X2 [Phlebotomus argentipes]|uniref:uncharacterized protein LOC132264553 isoform X2 n=1 Tax=Phlebotomus argentipes TaxID=94469 RepID=UPI002892A9AA|nr:uncharacterized protein LOC132264553 isoform X2 [Phlebotomus argentipes]
MCSRHSGGLPFIPEGYLIRATVGDTQLETDAFSGKGNSCRIDTKLVWEASKQDISRLKSRNVPIKMQCLVKSRRKDSQKCVGTLLFSIRNIPLVSQDKISDTSPHWHKMTKTSSGFTKGNIELLLAIAITKDACETAREEDFSEEESSAAQYLSGRETGGDWKGKIYHELVELEHWKRKQKNAFLYNLKQKEDVILTHLSSQWSAKCSEDSDKLAQNLQDCVDLKESLEREHKTLRELMTKSGKCKCGTEAKKEDVSRQILMENEQLRKENSALKEKMSNEMTLKEEISSLTKELRNVANALRECDKSKMLYKEELAKIHEILQDVCVNRTESKKSTFDLRNLLQREYRDMIEERREIESVKQSLYF